MKRRSQRIALLASLRHRQELNAAADLARLGEAQRRQTDLLEQVQQFDQDYRQGLGQALDHGVRAERLVELRRMTGHTHVACQQQRTRVAQAERNTDGGRRMWQAAHRQRRALEELALVFRRREARCAARREQERLDDLTRR